LKEFLELYSNVEQEKFQKLLQKDSVANGEELVLDLNVKMERRHVNSMV